MVDIRSPSTQGEPAQAELRAAEYKSVREEWLASRDAQQQTLQWTLGALAVLFAGIFASNVHEQQPVLYVGLVAGAGLISIFSQAIWFGEVMRMERASLYLRGLEVAASRLTRPQAALPPLMWETWRGSPPVEEGVPWIGPASLLIAACFGLYLTLTAAAIAILVVIWVQAQVPQSDQTFAMVAAIVETLGYGLATAYMGRQAWHVWKRKGTPTDLRTAHRDSPEVHAAFTEA